jgi:hypothetical protein
LILLRAVFIRLYHIYADLQSLEFIRD